jgi:REP element-mobilizing transposase RayT
VHLFISTLGRPSRPHALSVDVNGRRRRLSRSLGAIKTAFAKSLPIGEPRSPVMTSRGERGIWQRRYWEHTIRDDRDFAAHMDYTHFNPAKHCLVAHPADWPYSSFHRCVTSRLYPAGCGSGDEPQQTDERI